MKGEFKILGKFRVSGLDLEIAAHCEGFDEFEKTLSSIISLIMKYPQQTNGKTKEG